MNCQCDMNGRGAACHCRRCCLTFTGISAYDHHIIHGEHKAPSIRGLAVVRPDTWGWPSSDRRFVTPEQTGTM